jgi:glutamate/tyrosine decarboxylase-like PLP-dependent enzyme
MMAHTRALGTGPPIWPLAFASLILSFIISAGRRTIGLEGQAPVELTVVCFRYVPAHLRGNEAALDALNQAIVERVQTGGEVFLTQTILRDRFALRANVFHFDTAEEDLDALIEVVRRTGSALIAT